MYNTLIAGGGRTLLFPFVVHLQDVWRRVNGKFFGRCLASLLIQGIDSVDIRHWPLQIYYMKVINKTTINNYLQSC